MKTPFKREETPDFSKPEIQQLYVHEANNASALLRKEIDINRAEQDLLTDRIQTMNDSIENLPEFDPLYNTLLTQIHMDQIELDELKRREKKVVEKLNQKESGGIQ